jgi:signal transduction histidine kinase
VSIELLKDLNEELAKGNTDELPDITSDLIQNLEIIAQHGKRASSIVKGMLEHSRTSKGEKRPTDINALADEFLTLSYHGLRVKDKTFNANFIMKADKNLPKVNVVPQDIGRVFLNLINNAFYAVNEKSKQNIEGYKPEVIVSTSSSPLESLSRQSGRGRGVSSSPSTDGGPDGVLIRIRDNGPGISEEIKEKIFQPFFTTKTSGQGTGLGLSLSYDIIKAHGGELKVETEPGEGTTFIIKLPVDQQ